MTSDPTAETTGVRPHLWIGGYDPGNVPEKRFKENILSYAARHDLTLVVSQWNTTQEDARALEETLRAAHDRGVDVWLGTYDLREHSDEELLADEHKLDADIERLRRMVGVYADYYPKGNVFVWHEPPNTGQWTGDTREERIRSMIENGPSLFSAQKRAVADHYPDVSLGLMLWWHSVPPASHTHVPVVEPLMGRLDERNALPDFVYFDFYRGYYEWEGGHESVNDLVRASVRNVKENTGGRPVYYLGQSHTINNRYTPSKQAILGDLQTALDAGVDSYGWYVRKGYRETHPRSYRPFVPNHGTGAYGEQFNTVVGSRDRFCWATQLLLERAGVDPSSQFDLWLSGHDLEFYEHRVEARSADGDWEFLGDVSGYLDGSERYSGGGRSSVSALHGLDRERYLSDGELSLRLQSYGGGDGAVLDAVYAVPTPDAARYRTEPALAELLADRDDVASHTLGAVEPGTELAPGGETRLTVPVDEPSSDIRTLLRSTQRGALESLVEREANGLAPRERFDLWAYGRDLDAVSITLGETDPAEYRDASADRGTTPVDTEAVVYRGLERTDEFESHPGGQALPVEARATGEAELRGLFVQPYHGSVNFTPDATAARVIYEDYRHGEGELTTFALGHQCWPDGVDLASGDVLSTHVQVYPRSLKLGGV